MILGSPGVGSMLAFLNLTPLAWTQQSMLPF
jgi:hypothetical protein